LLPDLRYCPGILLENVRMTN